MELSTLFHAIRTYKWLMVAGLAVAIVAALLAGFTFVGGSLQLRSQPVYNSTTNILLSQPNTSEFQSQLPSTTIAEGKTAPLQRDLSALAVIYAYLASSADVKSRTEQTVGTLSDDESITAAQRTTQPSGSEKNPGRFSLPILQIVGTASSADRANEITQAAATSFVAYAKARQVAQNVAPNARVAFSQLEPPQAELSDDTSNPYIPIVATGVGVLLAFLALVLILFNVRSRRDSTDTPEAVEAGEAVRGRDDLPVSAQGQRPAIGWASKAEPQS